MATRNGTAALLAIAALGLRGDNEGGNSVRNEGIARVRALRECAGCQGMIKSWGWIALAPSLTELIVDHLRPSVPSLQPYDTLTSKSRIFEDTSPSIKADATNLFKMVFSIACAPRAPG